MTRVNSEFPRILTLLRKERGISQKQAATQLGVSQALLSHYEKGIRECGLDFVVRVSDFYGVSCDYLLGRSAEPGHLPAAVTATPNTEKAEPVGEHEMLLGGMEMLLRLSDRIGNDTLSGYVDGYLTAAVYRMFRQLYRLQPRNAESLFSVPVSRADLQARFQMEQAIAETGIMADDLYAERLLTISERESAILTTEILSSVYGQEGSEILKLIRKEEETFKK